MIIRTEVVTQAINGAMRARFLKEVVRIDAPEPLAMVRKRREGAETIAPVLLAHGFGQNRYAWHLTARSFVNHLAHLGFDVFNLDLRGHGRSRGLGSRGTPSVDEYIQEDFPAAIREVLAISGRSKCFLVGHSLGALVACGAAGISPADVAGVVAIGPPYRFARGSHALALFAYAMELVVRLGPAVGAEPLPIKLIGRLLDRSRGAFELSYIPVPIRAWHPGAFEPAMLHEYLRRSFDSATLGCLAQITRLGVRGEFVSCDGRVDYGAGFECSNVPVLVIAGAYDLMAPPASVRPLYDRSLASDKAYRIVPLGHADLLLGRDAPALTWPLVSQWLEVRAGGT